MARSRIDVASYACSAAQPVTLLQSSRTLGWTDLLLDCQRGEGKSTTFETKATGDVTLVVALKGRSTVRVHKHGRWHSAVYDVGNAGLTARQETTRLNWSLDDPRSHFEMAHLYLSDAVVREAGEEFRRVGARDGARPLNALIFRDDVVWGMGVSLVRAMTAGAPSIYADQASGFLATHLLSRHAGWWDADTDRRQPGRGHDRRIARAMDFMSAHLDAPLSLAEVAREAGISRFHLVRQFKLATGETPFGYLQGLRIELACRLLVTTDLTIAEIATRCGFARASSLSSAFQRAKGVTPATYRRDGAN